ncbi:NUDIX hydrolase [Demequina sp.]|uniref:NUDIX hydrolase n=1 Tax=Demequina sp. TaxID=2050685 RepID=UPI0025B9120B|nr:NUDIX hydrolase [Demequina sp.]
MKVEPADVVLAAGALVWRVRGGQLQVLAVHRPRYDDWSWPKGKLDVDETLPACAVREVAEETGRVIELGQPLPTLRYPIAGGKVKIVRYWAARVISSEAPAAIAREAVKDASKNEIDNVKWLTIEQARHLITFHDDLRPLERLIDEYEAGRLRSRVLILTRHARAKRRKAWKGKDIDRPITKAGRVRARDLVGLFAAFGTSKVASSPALRCRQTLEPYAEAAGLPIRTIASFTEPKHAKHPEATAKAFRALLSKKRDRVVSVHRPTLPTIVKILREHTTSKTRGALPRTMPYLPAGGVLIAHVIDHEGEPRVIAVESHLLKPAL